MAPPIGVDTNSYIYNPTRPYQTNRAGVYGRLVRPVSPDPNLDDAGNLFYAISQNDDSTYNFAGMILEIINLGKNAESSVLKALEDTNIYVVRTAIFVAGQIGIKAAIPKISEILSSSKDDKTKTEAIRALGELNAASAIGRITAVAIDTTNSLKQARSEAAIALGRIDSVLTIPTLKRLLTDTDADVRASAALGLGMQREKTATALILSMLKSPQPVEQLAATIALSLIGYTNLVHVVSEINTGSHSGLGAALASAKISSEETNAPFALVSSLLISSGSLSAQDSNELGKAANDLRNSISARMVATTRLFEAGIIARPWLEKMLVDQYKPARIQAARILGWLNSKESLPMLILMQQNTDPDVAEAARDAVNKIKNNMWKNGETPAY